MVKKKYENIFKAIEAEDIEAVRAFLPAQLEAKDYYGRTPLNLLCYIGNIEMVRLLLGYGADIEETNKFGWTALHYACYHKHPKISELFVMRGADPFIKNSYGESALDLDTVTVQDELGKEILHKEILIRLRAEYLMNKHTLEASERTAAITSGWEMEM